MSDPRHTAGRLGEERAAAWLASRGWTVLARRWRSSAGELDLVCLDQDRRLVGVEVRLRRGGRAGSAAESVTARHRSRLRASLVSYALETRVRHSGLRVDLVAVTPLADGWRLVRHPAIDAW